MGYLDGLGDAVSGIGDWVSGTNDDDRSTDWENFDAEGNHYTQKTGPNGTHTFGTPWTQNQGTTYSRLRTDDPTVKDTNNQGTGEDDYAFVMGGGDPRNLMYGRDPNAATNAANAAKQTGIDAQTRGIFASQRDVQNSQAANDRALMTGNWGQQNAALGTAATYGGRLAGLEAQEGPSAAQAQLQSGTNMAMAQQMAMARSGRGFGGNSAAMGLAQGNMAGISANQANQAAMLRAQENAQWRGRQASNLGNAASIQAGLGSQYGQQGQADLASRLASQRANDEAAIGWAGQGDSAYNNGVAANLNGQSLANQVRGAEMQGGQSIEDNAMRHWAAQNGYNLAQQQRQDQQDAAFMQFMATTGASLLGD